jgi:NADH:ubiquinone oxidoreductase subunit 4 (subunit M)
MRVIRIVWAGEGSDPGAEPVRDLRGVRWGIVTVLVAVMVVFGVGPHLLLHLSDVDATTLLAVTTR